MKSIVRLAGRLQKFPDIWLRIGVFCILQNCQILTRDGLDERENIFRKIFLGGFTSATRYNYGEEVKIGFW